MMAQMMDKASLGYLGESFQYRLAHEFMDDRTFFEDLSCIVDQNMFTDPYLKVFVGVMKNYFEVRGSVPSYDAMQIELRALCHNEKEIEMFDAVLNKIRSTPNDGSDRIKELAEKFFKQQNIVKAANEILRIAGDGDTSKYEACVNLLNDAMTKGVHNDFGEKPLDHLDETLSDDYRVPIPTGIGKIDEALEGGLGKGELGVIAGPSSFGKTSLTTGMASYAACHGFKVLQVVFEDRIKQIQRKHLARLTQIEARNLSKPAYIEEVRARLDACEYAAALQENLRIVRFPSGEKNATFLRNYIKKLIASGFKPDLAIFDYFECVELEDDKSTTNEYEREGKTMRKFEAMAGEFDMAIWIPSQGTKDSFNQELVTMDKMGGSVKKAQIAHIIMSISRTIDDIANNKATIAILKNRAGQSGKVFNNVDFNNGTCTISTDNVDELNSLFDLKRKQENERLNMQKEIYAQIRNRKKEQ